MLTIKAEIQRDKLRQDGTYNVKIRFTKGKQGKATIHKSVCYKSRFSARLYELLAK